MAQDGEGDAEEGALVRPSMVYMDVVCDPLHLGHVVAFRNARAFGDMLVVGVLTDGAVEEYKDRPIMPFDVRFGVVSAIRCVDLVVAQETFSTIDNLMKLRPHVRVYDPTLVCPYTEKEKSVMSEWGGVLVGLPRYPEISSTSIKEQIRGKG